MAKQGVHGCRQRQVIIIELQAINVPGFIPSLIFCREPIAIIPKLENFLSEVDLYRQAFGSHKYCWYQ